MLDHTPRYQGFNGPDVDGRLVFWRWMYPRFYYPKIEAKQVIAHNWNKENMFSRFAQEKKVHSTEASTRVDSNCSWKGPVELP